MKSPGRLLLERLARRRPRYAFQQSAPRLGICGLRLRLQPTSPLFSSGGGEVVELPFDDVITPVVLDRGSWQTEELDFIVEHLPNRAAILFDIGANVGLVARQLLNRVPNIKAAICFEPHPGNFLYLERNLAYLPHCHLVNVALGASDGELNFYEDVRNAGNYSLNVDAMLDTPYRTSTVRCVRVSDEQLMTHVPRADWGAPIIWKSDTQGYDELIMSGLSDEFWGRVQVGVMEILRVRRPTQDRSRLAQILGGFAVRWFSDEPGKSVAVDEVLDYASGTDGKGRDLFFART